MYIDVYFLINLILDWCSLKFALQRYKVSKWRLGIGAAVGAAGACLWEMLELSEMMRPIWTLVLSMMMMYICLGQRRGRQWMRALAELYGFSFFFAGILPYVSRFMPLWIGSILLSYSMIKLWLRWKEKKTDALLQVAIETDEAKWKVEAMVDTGHRLKEPITGSSVVIVKAESVPQGIQASWPICYESIQGKGMMFGFWPKKLWIGNQLYKEKEILVAVASDWTETSCDALIPGYIMD